MAILRVGAFPTISIVTTTTVTPAFVQATTAGNFLVAYIATTADSSNITCNNANWVRAATATRAGGGTLQIWTRQNCGASETAPTWTCSSSTQTYGVLVEFSGMPLTVAVEIQVIDPSAASGEMTFTPSSLPAAAPELECITTLWINSKSASYTFINSGDSSTSTLGTLGTQGTKALSAFGIGQYSVNGTTVGTASQGMTPSTGAITGSTGLLVRFRDSTPTAPAAPTGVAAVNNRDGTVQVNWTDETVGFPLSHYTVQRSTDNATWHQVAAGIASGVGTYTDDGTINYTPTAWSAATFPNSGDSKAFSVNWPGGTLGSVSLWLSKNGTPTDNVTVSVQSDSAGSPSGTVLATGASIPASSLGTGTPAVGTSSVVNANIAAQTIWIVVGRSGATDATNDYFLWDDGTANSQNSNPDSVSKTFGGGVWSTDTLGDNLYSLGPAVDLTPGTYWYRVAAYNASGETFATSVSVAVSLTPLVPTVVGQAVSRAASY